MTANRRKAGVTGRIVRNSSVARSDVGPLAVRGRRFCGMGLATVVISLLGLGCEQPQGGTATVQGSLMQQASHRNQASSTQPADVKAPGEDARKTADANAAAGPEAAGPPIAFVNGQPIARQKLLDVLLASRGLLLLQHMMLLEAVHQEAKRIGVEVAQDDVDHEYDLTLQAERYDGKDVERLTPARREQLVKDWMRSRGVQPQELAIAMERQATLRKIVAGGIKIDDAMLQQEFKRQHGDRVQIRHIQLAAPRVWDSVKAKLDQGVDFETLVRDYSQNSLSREKNGLLPPFSADDPSIPAALVKAAFAMEPGQVSNPLEIEGTVHVIKLEQRIPADDVKLEDVRDSLARTIQARMEADIMESLAQRLLMNAKLRIEDPVLRDQYRQRRDAREIVGPPLVER